MTGSHEDADGIWHWLEPVPGRPEMAGDLARLFNRGGFEVPWLFEDFDVSGSASLFAREVIQNSWDAFKRLHPDGRDEQGLGLHIEFRFRRASGATESRQLRDALGLGELKSHVQSIDESRSDIGLEKEDCLSKLAYDPLTVLEVIEHNGAGMAGDWDATGESSAMARALIWVGWANRSETAGGSYGYGKAGVAQGSRIRSVIAYTCFAEPADDGVVTRRLLGATYWNRHSRGDRSFTGWGLLGERREGGVAVAPLNNDEADLFAERIGLEPRSADSGTTGTTLLILDPAFGPEELLDATAFSWWPALMSETGLTTEVVDLRGDAWESDVESVEVLDPFTSAFRLVVDPNAETPEGLTSKSFNLCVDFAGQRLPAGRLILVADETEWTFPSRYLQGTAGHRSVVALMRSPRMIVKYLQVGEREPFVRGVFVASDELDPILRATEPAAHDDWSVRGPDQTHKAHRRTAKLLREEIVRSVQAFQLELAPPIRTGEAFSTPVCGELLAGMNRGKLPSNRTRTTTPRTPTQRPVAIRLVHADGVQERPEAVVGSAPDTVRARAQVEFELLDHYERDRTEVVVRLALDFVEDDGKGGRCQLHVEDAPPGFERIESTSRADADTEAFRGKLEKGIPVRFLVESIDYADDSSTQFAPKVEVLG